MIHLMMPSICLRSLAFGVLLLRLSLRTAVDLRRPVALSMLADQMVIVRGKRRPDYEHTPAVLFDCWGSGRVIIGMEAEVKFLSGKG
jgi:hypothetical protein